MSVEVAPKHSTAEHHSAPRLEGEALRPTACRDRGGWNLTILAVYQVLLRLAWIFKTESVIVPAFLDLIAGAGWVRGCLPILNRFGQSVPPLLFAPRLSAMRYKKRALACFTMAQGIPFLLLGSVWSRVADSPPSWLPPLFLLLYAVFFVCTGISQLSLSTVQGKLISPNRRGRLLAVSFFSGALIATSMAWWLLGNWLASGAAGFATVFLFTGSVFLVTGACAMLLAEPPNGAMAPGVALGTYLRDLYGTLSADRRFRRLVPVAALFACALILFPHYQALGRERLGLSGSDLMVFVVVQNLALGLFSLLVGPIADRFGNRIVLMMLLVAASTTPLWAVVLAELGPERGGPWYWTMFIPLGLTPVTMRTLINYTLELTTPANHPRYLSVVSACLAAPFLISPLVGWLVDAAGFEVVFLTAAALIATGSLAAAGLAEPRHRRPAAVAGEEPSEP